MPLRQAAARFAQEIRKGHGLLDPSTGEQLSRLVKTSVTYRSRPGRKSTPEVLKAVKLRKEGARWPIVYSAVFPGYWKLPYADRFYLSHRLRDAVRAHFRRRRNTAHKRPSE